MEKVLKIGIIGCGAIGKDHCRRIIETVPGATVVAVSDYVAAAADDTAAKYGIKDGDWVWMEGPLGRAKRKAKLTPIMDRRIVSCDHGWWFPEEDGSEPNLYGTFRSNINNLIPNFHVGKLGFGAPFKCMLCNIEGTNESFDTDMQLIQDKFGELR